MSEDITLLIHGVETAEQIPGIDRISADTRILCAPGLASLQRHLPEADVLLGWNFRATELRQAWPLVDRLRWIQWGGAGVDAVLFPELAASDVLLTNARGVFDRAMAEYMTGSLVELQRALNEAIPERSTVGVQEVETLLARMVQTVGNVCAAAAASQAGSWAAAVDAATASA